MAFSLENPEEPLLWEQIIDLRMIRDQQAPLSLINVEDDLQIQKYRFVIRLKEM